MNELETLRAHLDAAEHSQKHQTVKLDSALVEAQRQARNLEAGRKRIDGIKSAIAKIEREAGK